jgi:Ner family transcriptional regulator
MPKKGWHRADIVAAVHKRGTSLAQLARDNGLGDSTLRNALTYPRRPSNEIVASFLGCSLHELWPHWFDASGRLVITRRDAARGGHGRSSQKRRAVSALTTGSR